MTDLVPAGEIEEIVGIKRSPFLHYGKAVSAKGTVYILHSQRCLDTTPDLRDCPFSLALDRGIENPYPWQFWEAVQDTTVHLEISRGFLIPIELPHNDPA